MAMEPRKVTTMVGPYLLIHKNPLEEAIRTMHLDLKINTATKPLKKIDRGHEV